MHTMGHDSIMRGMLTHLLAIYGPQHEKTCLRWVANNKGTDMPARMRSLISTFVIRVLESTISQRTTSEISFFYLVSVAEQAGLILTLFETQKIGFVPTRLILGMSA